MLDKKMQKALNEQINKEIYSAYLYLAMSAYFEGQNLKGFANWMYIQAQEEMTHALKFYHFIIDRRGDVEMYSVDAPKKQWKDAVEVFQAVLSHEQKVTASIHQLVHLALELKDYATESFLRWFVDEQVEEESSADEILQRVKLAQKEPSALFFLDNELAQRTFTPPAQA
ncbi:MAG: ferritin [Gammaproteobacteria bacterium]|nr:ferritin [Gammaproteobacteria bacterium]